tara:strand:+ start:32511 stop:33896 length:1386 start_codon:yes stop_codon:yes gene_type:complete
MAAINPLVNSQSNKIWRETINDHSTILQSKVVRWNGTSYFAESTINNAITNAGSGDTIFLKSGVFTENIVLNKPGITIIGEGPGTWDGNTCVGGTQINPPTSGSVGFSWQDAAVNCRLQDVALVASSNLNELSFFGSTGTPVFNCVVENVSWYGNGINIHNVEFRGKNWYVKNVKSYNAGNHNFAIKASDSTFRDVFVDTNGDENASAIIVKSHSSANYGNCKNTIIDGWKVIFRGTTHSQGGIFISNADAVNEVTDNIIIKNGYVENASSGNNFGIYIKGPGENIGSVSSYSDLGRSGNIIKNVSIDNCVFKGVIVGVLFHLGFHDQAGKGIDGVVIRDCSFIDPLPLGSASRVGVQNNWVSTLTAPNPDTTHFSVAKNVVVSNCYAIGYQANKIVVTTDSTDSNNANSETPDVYNGGSLVGQVSSSSGVAYSGDLNTTSDITSLAKKTFVNNITSLNRT